MTEDKLTPAERRRLEALAQSVAFHGMKNVSAETIIEYANRFDDWIKSAIV